MAVHDHARVHVGLTESGRVLLQGTVCVLLGAMVVPAFGILAALVAAVVTALVAGFVLRPRVRISSDLPESVIAGQTVQLRCRLANAARVPAYNLCVELDALPAPIESLDGGQIVTRLAPGDTAEVTLAITAHRRGSYRVPAPVCRTGFPFNLFVFGTSPGREQTLLVLPPVFPLRLAFEHRTQRVSSSASGFAGRTEVSPEYAGSRPFLLGDSPRRIDARAWARLSVPATKEYYNDHDSSAMLVMDSRIPGRLAARSDPVEPFEAAVCLAASAAFALSQSCSVDLVLIGSTLHRFTNVPRTAQFNAVHHMLATVQPSGDYDLVGTMEDLAGDWRQTSEVVFVLLALDKMYGELIKEAAGARCHTTVLLLGDSARVQIDTDSAAWAEYIAVLSPRDVLEGRLGDL